MAESTDKQLLPVYLFAGSDGLKRTSLLKRLMTRIGKDCDLTVNAQFFDASQSLKPTEVLDACTIMPFLSPLRLVVIRSADKASKQLQDALVDYLKKPCETTILVLEAEKLAKNSRLITAVKKINEKAYIDCSEKNRSELPALVQTMARSRGIDLTYDAANRLIELVGTSTIALDKEIEKLTGYVSAFGRTNAGRSDIDAVITRSVERSPWDLVEAFASRSRGKSLAILDELSGESPVNLLALCVMRLRELITVKALQERGLSTEHAIAAQLGRPDWQVRRLVGAARNFSAAELRGLLVKAAEVDRKMKDGYNAHLLLSTFLLEA